MKKDKKHSRTELTILNDSTLTIYQKKAMFKIIGANFPKKYEVNPILNRIIEKAGKVDGIDKPFPIQECSTRLKNALHEYKLTVLKFQESERITLADAYKIATDGKFESLKGAGKVSFNELVVKLDNIFTKEISNQENKRLEGIINGGGK